jgi:putative tryptophan/tyrosine transport system substrate-binding protein
MRSKERRREETAVRRRFAGYVVAVALGLLGATVVDAAPPHRIGWLSPGSAPSGPNRNDSDFQQGLRDLGYIEGQNVVIEYRYANGDVARLPDLAAELVRLPVVVIVTSGEPAALAAKRATKAIPIVVTQIAMDPVKSGLVVSLGRPEGNVTGLATLSEDLWQKRLGLLKEIAPKVSRVALLWNPKNPGNATCVEEIKAAAPAMRLQVLYLEVRDANALDRAFATMASESADALVTCWDSVLLEHARPIADFALKRRLPMMSPLKEYVQVGGLISLGSSLPAERRRTAYYVDRILKGAKAADLPLERPTIFELVLNLKTAKALGITLSASLLVQADDLIE